MNTHVRSSIWLAGSQNASCYGYPQEVKRNKTRLHSEDLICWAFQFQTLFNGEGGNLEKYDFQLKLYENGEQNIQF